MLRPRSVHEESRALGSPWSRSSRRTTHETRRTLGCTCEEARVQAAEEERVGSVDGQASAIDAEIGRSEAPTPDRGTFVITCDGAIEPVRGDTADLGFGEVCRRRIGNEVDCALGWGLCRYGRYPSPRLRFPRNARCPSIVRARAAAGECKLRPSQPPTTQISACQGWGGAGGGVGGVMLRPAAARRGGGGVGCLCTVRNYLTDPVKGTQPRRASRQAARARACRLRRLEAAVVAAAAGHVGRRAGRRGGPREPVELPPWCCRSRQRRPGQRCG